MLGGLVGTTPKVGLKPTTPLNALGTRMEPPPSVPTASGPKPAATAATAPALLPPGVCDRLHGLRVVPLSGLSPMLFKPNPEVVVLPSSTAPCSRSRATAGASSGLGSRALVVFEPRRVGRPRWASRSLTDTGTPSSRPNGSPALQRASDACAAANAASAST